MPIRKNHSKRNKIILWIVVGVALILTLISFSPARQITEVVLL